MSQARYFVVFIAIIFCVKASAQVSPDSIKSLLDGYLNKFPKEKLYIHLDKSVYSLGDTIWFKGYLTNATSHLADSASKTIYVDLIRKDNAQLISHKIIRNDGGFSHGEFLLSDSLIGGRYEVIGYTNWMRNFSEDFFFRKEIIISTSANMQKKDEKQTTQLIAVADLQFFPEGGNLIAGLQNRVAFKAVNQYGKGVDFKAFIISEKKDTATAIASQHLGMGTFVFKPKTGETYFAVVEQSSAKQFQLPELTASSYTFIVDNLSNKGLIKVSARNNYSTKDRPFLIGQQRGNVVFALQSNAEGNSFAWTLPKDSLKDNGIVQLTLFNGQGVPQCERLIYHYQEPPLKISITPDKSEYLPHEKVELTLNVKDPDDYPVTGNFSLSVTDGEQVRSEINGANIYNYLYLTSDAQELPHAGIKGIIEQPDYYFNQSNPNSLVHLDILLMTQGWRRFLWPEVLKPKSANLPYEIEASLSVQGNVVLANGKSPAKPMAMTLFYSQLNEAPKYLTTTTDATGKFIFRGIEAENETTVFLQGVKGNGGRNVILSIDKPDAKAAKPNATLSEPIVFDKGSYLNLAMVELEKKIKQSKGKLLKEVEVTAHREKKPDPRRIMYEGTNVTTIVIGPEMCSTITPSMSILLLLQGRVAGLVVSPNGALSIRGRHSIVERNPNFVAVMVDGMLMDRQMLSAIPPCQIESIDVVTHPVSSINAGGLVSILTKGGANGMRDWSGEASAPGTLVAKIKGYDIPKEFYNPKYLTTDIATSQTSPDFRSTVFWDPIIKTDLDGNAKVIFWNSDQHTTIRVSLEGISNEGKPGNATFNYKVK